MATNNPINFPNLTTKGTPVGADILLLADSAASNAVKQATVTSILASASGSGWVKLASVTAATSATLDFDNMLSATYDNYVLMMENMFSSAQDFMWVRVGTGAGPTYQATNYSGVTGGNTIATTWTATVATISTASEVAHTTPPATTTQITSGIIYVTNCNDATNFKPIGGQLLSYYGANTNNSLALSATRWEGATVLTSLRVLYKTGNITTGTIKLYGISN